MGGLKRGAWSSPSQETPEEGRHPPIQILLFPAEQGLTVTSSPCDCEGQHGSWGKGQPRWEGARPAPAATEGQRWGGKLADFQLPRLCPSPGLSQKELSVLLQHSRPREGDLWPCGWGREEGRGVVLLPLFLSCLGSPLALNLCRLLAAEPEIPARTGGGTGPCVPSSVPAGRKAGWALRGRGCCRELLCLATICTCQTYICGLGNVLNHAFDSNFHELHACMYRNSLGSAP